MIRSLRRPVGRAVAALPVAALGTALLLSGCGGPTRGGSAAVVGDRRITEADLQTATRELQLVVGPEQKLTQPQVLSWLVLAPFVLDVAAKNNVGVSVDDAIRQLDGKVAQPAEPTILAARSAVAITQLSQGLDPALAQQAYQDVANQVKTASVDVNPRYGSFNPADFSIADQTPNWIKQDPVPAGPTNPADPANPDGSAPGGQPQPAPTNS